MFLEFFQPFFESNVFSILKHLQIFMCFVLVTRNVHNNFFSWGGVGGDLFFFKNCFHIVKWIIWNHYYYFYIHFYYVFYINITFRFK